MGGGSGLGRRGRESVLSQTLMNSRESKYVYIYIDYY